MKCLRANIYNKKKGFTLIELLAVIVILAVIAVIATPIMTNVINDARKNTFKNSAYGIVQAANQYYLNSKLNGEIFHELTFTVNNNKLMSENKELLFSGKPPIGSSYVKINSEGEVAMNITDGTYYATKEYDETGVSITVDETTAVTREELAQKVSHLESLLNTTTTELNDLKTVVETNSSLIGANASMINNNSLAITTLSDANNSFSLYQKIYPIGSKYITKTNENPSSYLGGTWTLVEKNMKYHSGDIIDDTKYFTKSSDVSSYQLYYVVKDNSYFIRLKIMPSAALNENEISLGTLNFEALGFTRISYTSGYLPLMTDTGNGIAMLQLAYEGEIKVVDIISKSSATSLPANVNYYVVANGIINDAYMLDEYCDEFVWERIS